MFYIIFKIIAFLLHSYTMSLIKNILKLCTCLFKREQLISNNYNTQFEFVILSIQEETFKLCSLLLIVFEIICYYFVLWES